MPERRTPFILTCCAAPNAGAGGIKVFDLKAYGMTKQLSEVVELESGVIFCTYAL